MADPTYVTRDQLKDWLKLPLNDTSVDGLVDLVLASTHRWVRDNTGNRRFDLAAVASARLFTARNRQVCTEDGRYKLLVDDIGDMAGLVVETGVSGGTFTVTTTYDVDPLNALLDGRPVTGLVRAAPWPWLAGAQVRITARWGWPAVPSNLIMAMLIQAGRTYRRRTSPEGVIASADWGAVRVSRSDPDAQDLLDSLSYAGMG